MTSFTNNSNFCNNIQSITQICSTLNISVLRKYALATLLCADWYYQYTDRQAR